MSLQLALVIGLVFFASCYLGWRGWRVWTKAAKGCGGGCHCSNTAQAPEQPTGPLVSISRDRLDLRNKA
jgi:hypothetical protein